MNEQLCWGIFRELAHSPGRESDDAEILRLTGKHLEAAGFQVALKSPEKLSETSEVWPRFVFLMCERREILATLRARERHGLVAVNRPGAVLNTYRNRMVARLHAAKLPFVPSRVLPTRNAESGPWRPCWIKRGDVHNTQEGDVVFAEGAITAARALERLAQRGIARAVVQPHVEGDLVKFYGIGRGEPGRGAPAWFRWFYHREQRVAGYPLDSRRLNGIVRGAAGALGLDIYGGDAIVTASGQIVLLDMNAWPSFALYREEAAAQIAAYLTRGFVGADR
jgi:hypothetical protein